MGAAPLTTQVRNRKKGKKMDLQWQRVFFLLYMSTRVMEGAVEKPKSQKYFSAERGPKGDRGREDDCTCLSRKETTSVDSQ